MRFSGLLAALGCLLLSAACGGGSGSSTSTITFVGVSCNPTAITSGNTSQCTASVSGTGSYSSTVTWVASSGGTINATSGQFTAGTVPFTTQVTITATSTQDTTKIGSTVITVAAAGTVTAVTASCNPTTIQTGQLSACTATVQGNGNFSPNVDWTASGGSINPITGIFSTPFAGTYTITATSQQTPTVTGTVTIHTSAGVNNKLPIVVDQGPTGTYVNGGFVTITVCTPGTSTCQTIDHVLVDTGSAGLRLLAQSAGGELNPAAFPQQVDSNGNPLAQCNQFVDGFTWGSVALATIQLTFTNGTPAEVASTVPGAAVPGVPIQIIGDSRVPAVPSTCSATGNNEGTLQTLMANGVLGLGTYQQDCGTNCASGNTPPNWYYTCSNGSCAESFVPLSQQVTNPDWALPNDNNGVLVQLPTVPAGGTTTVSGDLIFGIGTQSDNALGSATVFDTSTTATFNTTFNGLLNACSYIDSGSNAYYFPASNYPQLLNCTGANSAFYCPTSNGQPTALGLSASNQSATNTNGASGTAAFNVGNATSLFGNTSYAVLSELGGSSTPANNGTCGVFAWGLPFFYGKANGVFTGIQGQSVTGTSYTGPFWAY